MKKLKLSLLIGLPLYGILVMIIPDLLGIHGGYYQLLLNPAMPILLYITFPLRSSQSVFLEMEFLMFVIVSVHLLFWCPIALLINRSFENHLKKTPSQQAGIELNLGKNKIKRFIDLAKNFFK